MSMLIRVKENVLNSIKLENNVLYKSNDMIRLY